MYVFHFAEPDRRHVEETAEKLVVAAEAVEVLAIEHLAHAVEGGATNADGLGCGESSESRHIAPPGAGPSSAPGATPYNAGQVRN